MPDAAALLHGQRRFLQLREDTVERIRDAAHDEAVEQGDVAVRSGPRKNAAGGQETVVLEDSVKAVSPNQAVAGALRRRHGMGNTAPAVLDCCLRSRTVTGAEAILHRPDLPGDGVEGRARGDIHCRASGLVRSVIRPSVGVERLFSFCT